MFYNPDEDDSEFARQYKDLQLGDYDNALFKQGNPLSDLGMLPGYAEAQRDYGYRLPGLDNDDAVIPVVQSERGAIDDEAELAKSKFLRSEKAGYQTGAFDGRDISRAGDTMTALFKKNYGYTPSAGELIQYADLARSSNPREFTENVQDRGRYSPLRLRPNQIYNQDRISGARGLLSEFSENGNRIDTSPLKVLSEARNSHRNNDYRDEAAFEDLINGYSGAEDSSWYSKSDQSEMSQNDMRREIDLLNRRTNTLASESKSGIISTNGKDYYLMTRDPNGLGIYQQRDLGDSASRDARFDQGGEADDIQKVTVTGRRMSNMEKENYDREQMQLSMQKYRSREQAHSGNKSSPFLKVPTGQITFNAEGNDVQNSIFFTRKLHHPSYESGVTIGRGYDMKNRSQEQVRSDLISAGMSQEQAEKYAKGAGLKGEKAEQFVKNNRAALETMSLEVQNSLFSNYTYPAYVNNARKEYQKAIAGDPNAVSWDDLDDKVKDIAIDLNYHQGRIRPEQMPAIKSNNRNVLARRIIDDPRTYKYEQGRQRSAYLRRN